MVTHIVANRYTLDQKIGSGGMGDVFRGLDQRTDTPIAIKVLKSELATQEMVARFIREGEALRQLNHPNIVTMLDAVQENNKYYLVMDLVEGGALDELLRRTPQLPVLQVLNIALDLADERAVSSGLPPISPRKCFRVIQPTHVPTSGRWASCCTKCWSAITRSKAAIPAR